MVAHKEIVERVAAHTGVGDTKQAQDTIRAVARASAANLPPTAREALRSALPPALSDAAEVSGGREEAGDIVSLVSTELSVPPERGFHLAQAVLSELTEAHPELGRELRGALPDGAADLVTEPTALAGRTGDEGVPTPLTGEEVAEALERLPDWAGDHRMLVRTVELPADRVPPLLTRINRAAQELGNHAAHERSGDTITFTVRTRSVNAVTEQDLRLAESIDDAIAAIGSGG